MATYIIGETETITWSSENIPNLSGTDQIIIELSIDSGENWETVSTQDNTGIYEWTVPDSPTTHGLIRISAVDNDTGLPDEDRSYTTPEEFIISEGGAIIISTLSTANYGVPYPLIWTNEVEPEDGDTVTIEITTDGGVCWDTVSTSTPNDGFYSIVVPDVNTSTAQIRITMNDRITGLPDPDRSTTSNSFTIIAPVHNYVQVIGSSTPDGCTIGGSVSSKISFYGKDPIIQRAGAAQAAVITTPATNSTPYGYGSAAQANTIISLLNELRVSFIKFGVIKGAA